MAAEEVAAEAMAAEETAAEAMAAEAAEASSGISSQAAGEVRPAPGQ